MDYLISFINDLTNDLFYDKFFCDATLVYTAGGCYEYAKIIKKIVPACEIYVSYNKQHCIIKYDGKFYDTLGEVTKDIDQYKKAEQDDIYYMEDNFGGNLKQFKLYDTIIDEISNIDMQSILKNHSLIEEQKSVVK